MDVPSLEVACRYSDLARWYMVLLSLRRRKLAQGQLLLICKAIQHALPTVATNRRRSKGTRSITVHMKTAWSSLARFGCSQGANPVKTIPIVFRPALKASAALLMFRLFLNF